MSKYTEKDASKDTGSSGKETSKAWHDAHDHAAKDGKLDERNRNKLSDSSIATEIWEFFFGKK